jgi:choline dehydrogenase-like flavoprotein
MDASRFDVVILGGGTAGCVLAARLSQNPERSVCLVEAGPDYGPYADGRWPEDIVDGRQLAFSHSWETDREDRSQLRAKILGGCSAHNACAIFEPQAEDYAAWAPGLAPYLARAREALRVRRFEEHELSPWHRAFAALGAELNEANAVGAVRWNTAFAYLDAARDRPNLTIYAGTLVDRIDDGRALTSSGELQAPTIVLTAGAYGSPAILLRSGIENGVGEGLVDHVGVGAAWEPTPKLHEETARFEASQSLFMAAVTLADGDLFIFPALDSTDYEVSAVVFNMRPRSRGSVRLSSADPRDPPLVEHGFLADERDAAVLQEGFEQLRALADTEPVRRLTAGEIRPGPEVDVSAYVRENARGFFHPMGTCAIGRVVDTEGRVLGVDGLYVADASIIPLVSRPTNLTVVALAERIAEVLAQ